MNDEISEIIDEEVQSYSKESYDYLDEVKKLVFTCLIGKISYNIFKGKLNKVNSKYNKIEKNRTSKGYKKVKDKVVESNKSPISSKKIDFTDKDLSDLLFKIDKTSQIKAKDKFVRIITNYYKTSLKTAKKEYISIDDYLKKKLTQYDKVEKVVAYHNQDGTIRAYHDIASYNSMVYNTNLTSSAWNETIKYCYENNTDIVYVEPHPFSCPLCQEWQGQFYSLTGKSSKYKNIEVAYKGGLKHPNCKHNITTNVGQKETDDYSSDEWKDRYQARQKKQALELKRKRLKTDQDIYKELNNYEEVDKCKQQISVLNKKIQDERNAMRGIQSTNYQDYKYQQKQKELLKKQKEQEKIQKEKQIKKELQKQSSQTHKEMQELFKIRENRPKYISQLEEKQQKLKEVQQIIRKNEKDMKYWNAKQEELSLKVDIKNLKELINK